MIVRLTRTFPRTTLPGAGLHAYYYTKFIGRPTVILTKRDAAPVLDVPSNAELVQVEYSDFSFRRKRERLRYPLIAAGKLYGDLRFLLAALGLLRTRFSQIRIIHLHSHPYILTALILRRLSGAPVFVGCHGTDVLRLEGNRLMTWLLARADGFLYVSSEMEPRLRALFPGKELFYTGNLVDLTVFTPSAVERETVFLAVGNLRWQKDYPTLLRAFAKFCERNDSYQLLIAGEGPDRAALEEQVNVLGLGARVRFLGMLDREAVRERFCRARALVLSSVSEGFPKVLIEAMACGTPVIATDVGDCRAVIGAAGRVVPPSDDEALSEAMWRAANDEAMYQDMMRNCRAQADKYGVEKVVARVIAAYESQIARREAKGRRSQQ